MSCACHWTVGVAASAGHGKLYGEAYSVAPAGIFVPADSPVKRPTTWPPCRSRSATSPAATTRRSRPSSSTCRLERITLSFNDGMLFRRMELLIQGKAPAVALFSGPYYFAEQLGFRKIIDTTFMIATMIHGEPIPTTSAGFSGPSGGPARHRPSADRYTHYYRNEFPSASTRHGHATLGPGERMVFEPYTKEVFEETFRWIAERGIFADGGWARATTIRRS